ASLLRLRLLAVPPERARGGTLGTHRLATSTALADARLAAPLGANNHAARRQRADAGAAPRRHRVPDPGDERPVGLWLPGAVRALDGRLRVRHLRLCLDLGAADRAGA